MPKHKTTNSERFKKYIREFENNVLKIHSSISFIDLFLNNLIELSLEHL